MSNVLLVLGEQAREAVIEENVSQESLYATFRAHFPNQILQPARTVLQIWDEQWKNWVDLENVGNYQLKNRKVRLVRREKMGQILGNLSPETSAFLCCDMQERFKPAISHFEDITLVASRLLQGAYILEIPVFVTEQYPKGLLHTVPELDTTKAKAVIEKTRFSMMVPELEQKFDEYAKNVKSVILFGVEAHVCIQQTALDLLAKGVEVHIIADATSSRSDVDRQLAFYRLRSSGAIITTAESVLLQLIKDKNHSKFKEIQGLIKVTPPQSGILGIQSSL